MTIHDFYEDRRHCPTCAQYVLYLSALEAAYCVQCGGRVRLFSQEHMQSFRRSLKNGSRSVDFEEDPPRPSALEPWPSEATRFDRRIP